MALQADIRRGEEGKKGRRRRGEREKKNHFSLITAKLPTCCHISEWSSEFERRKLGAARTLGFSVAAEGREK